MDTLMQFELEITLFFQNLGGWLAGPFKAFTFLGNEVFYILFFPALYWCVDATLGFRLAVMMVFTNSVNGYIKDLFHSPRPFWVDSRVKAFVSETSFGLPSGHAQNAASIWGVLAASLKKTWLTVLCVLVIFMIGLSRIYLGVHFTRDVLSGWLIGIVLILLYFWAEKFISRWISKKTLLFKIVAEFLVAILIILIGALINKFNQNWLLPADWVSRSLAAINAAPDPYNMEGYFTISGVWFGFTAGYAWWLQRQGKIVIKGSVVKRILRYVLGLVGVLALYLGLKLIFPVSPEWLGFTFRFIRYMFIGLWVSALAPFLFEKMHLDE